MNISLIIIHFNNPSALSATLNNIIFFGFNPKSIVVFDNGSKIIFAKTAEKLTLDLGCLWEYSNINRGWGGAINFYMKSRNWFSNDLVLISAHDANIHHIDIDKIKTAFLNPAIAFISPQYPDPQICTYSTSRSFKAVHDTNSTNGKVIIGHATLCVARAKCLLDHPFDEEFFIYGCESEIFLRICDAGLTTLLWNDFVVSNPTTDASSDFRTRAFTINSIYLAHKRGGIFSFLKRTSVVILSILKLYFSRHSGEARAMQEALWFAITHPGAGFLSYMKKRKTQ